MKSFPYGLNDRLGDDFIKEDNHVLVGSKFFLLPRKPTRISQNHVHKLIISVS